MSHILSLWVLNLRIGIQNNAFNLLSSEINEMAVPINESKDRFQLTKCSQDLISRSCLIVTCDTIYDTCLSQ